MVKGRDPLAALTWAGVVTEGHMMGKSCSSSKAFCNSLWTPCAPSVINPQPGYLPKKGWGLLGVPNRDIVLQ